MSGPSLTILSQPLVCEAGNCEREREQRAAEVLVPLLHLGNPSCFSPRLILVVRRTDFTPRGAQLTALIASESSRLMRHQCLLPAVIRKVRMRFLGSDRFSVLIILPQALPPWAR